MALKILWIVMITASICLIVLRALVIAKVRENEEGFGIVVRSDFQYGDALAWRVLRVPSSLTTRGERVLFRTFFVVWILVYFFAAVILCVIWMDSA